MRDARRSEPPPVHVDVVRLAKVTRDDRDHAAVVGFTTSLCGLEVMYLNDKAFDGSDQRACTMCALAMPALLDALRDPLGQLPGGTPI